MNQNRIAKMSQIFENFQKFDCSKRSKLKFLKIKLSLFSNRKIFKSNILKTNNEIRR